MNTETNQLEIENNVEYDIAINSRCDVEEQLETARHEMAHFIDYQKRGFSCHDEYWQRIYDTLSPNADNYLDKHRDS
jgi:predicted SprT family Zn-dependent metalloprotease